MQDITDTPSAVNPRVLRAYTRSQTPREELERWNRACASPLPFYRAKFVRLAHGQFELSVTSANVSNVINARMGFNPLLDCPRQNRTPEEQIIRDAENRARAAKRAKQTVRHLIKSGACDHMLTFTYRENITDRALVGKHWQDFVRLYRVRYPDWAYVAVLEYQGRGALHIHVAVHGKQNIRWLLRCWLIAIGQPHEDVVAWYTHGIKLGDKSFGAVNVQPPLKRWGGGGEGWKKDKLSGYLTKYIGKDFDKTLKNTKSYWASKNFPKKEVERFWLRADNYLDAVREAHDLVFYSGCDSLSMWGDDASGVIWISGETCRANIGKIKQSLPDFDFLAD